jgi:hypothetical protein
MEPSRARAAVNHTPTMNSGTTRTFTDAFGRARWCLNDGGLTVPAAYESVGDDSWHCAGVIVIE